MIPEGGANTQAPATSESCASVSRGRRSAGHSVSDHLEQVLPVDCPTVWSLSPAVAKYREPPLVRLQLVRLLFEAVAQLRACDYSSECGGGAGMSRGVAHGVLWVLVLRKLSL